MPSSKSWTLAKVEEVAAKYPYFNGIAVLGKGVEWNQTLADSTFVATFKQAKAAPFPLTQFHCVLIFQTWFRAA